MNRERGGRKRGTIRNGVEISASLKLRSNQGTKRVRKQLNPTLVAMHKAPSTLSWAPHSRPDLSPRAHFGHAVQLAKN